MTSPYRQAPREPEPEARVAVRWVAREPPLAPVAVVALGDVVSALRDRLLREGDTALSALRGVVGEGVMVITGATDALPWVDGARWLGRDLAAPALLLPTGERPSVDAGLFEKALLRGEHGAPPLAVLRARGGLAVVSLAEARPVSRAELARVRGAP